MIFILIFVVFFSWVSSAAAHLYPTNKNGMDQFLKFKSIENDKSSYIKSSPINNVEKSFNEKKVFFSSLTNRNKDVINEGDKKINFKRFGNGKTVNREIYNKNKTKNNLENICETPNEKIKSEPVASKTFEHKTTPASKNTLPIPASFSNKTKKETNKKEFLRSLNNDSTKKPLEKKEVEKKTPSISLVKPLVNKPLSADQLMNEKISVEVSSGDVFSIVSKLMPPSWRVMMSVKNNNLINKRFYFVTTKSRAEALNDLSDSVGVKFYYFFDLKDENKNPSPLLIVSDK